MTDEIYDYFGGNAAKKVEPIEDDDLEMVDAPVADEQQTEAANQSQVEEPVADSVAEVKPVEAPDQVDSWGSLLGELGIEDVAPKVKPVPEAAPKPAPKSKTARPDSKKTNVVPDVQRTEEKTSREKPVDFLGLEPIPSPEDDTVLNDMFAPSGSSDFSESTSDEDSQESEYLEFEIEELDVSPYKEGEEESFGRRSRRRPKFDEQAEEEAKTEKQVSENRSDRRPSRNRDSRREEGARSRRTPRKSNRNQETSDSQKSEFAAGIDLDSESPTEVEKPKRSRRRSRGRGRGRDRDREREPEVSNQSDSEPAAEFVDEIGWEVPGSKSSSGNDNFEPAAGDDDMVDFSDEPVSEPASRTRPKRRRRRGGKSRTNRQSEERGAESDSEFSENTSDLDVVDFDEDARDDVGDRDDDRPRSKGRRSSGRGARRSKSEDSGDQGTSSKRPKFPTWEEAVSGMIESNIKNHSRSSGRGGSGGRGRGRGRSGGRNTR